MRGIDSIGVTSSPVGTSSNSRKVGMPSSKTVPKSWRPEDRILALRKKLARSIYSSEEDRKDPIYIEIMSQIEIEEYLNEIEAKPRESFRPCSEIIMLPTLTIEEYREKKYRETGLGLHRVNKHR